MIAATVARMDTLAAQVIAFHSRDLGHCTRCGIRIGPVMHTIPSPDGGRECYYEQACRERQQASAA
jgi:hypothetical protein